MAGLENYASRQLGDAFAPPAAGKRSSTPQPQHTWSKQRVNDPIERQPRSKSRDDRGPVRTSAQHAASLKVPVNNTLVTARKPLRTQSVPQNHPAIASVAQHSKSHGPSAQSYQEPAVSAFDDTQSIHFDDSTSIAEEQDSRPDVHFASHSRNERINNQAPYHLNKSSAQKLPHNWKAVADRERERQGEHPKFRESLQHNTAESVYNNEQSDDGYEPDGEYYPEEEGPEANDTPSRPRLALEGHPEAAAPIQFVKQEAHHAIQEEPQNRPSPPPQYRYPFGDTQHGVHVEPFPEQPKNRFQTGKQLHDNGLESSSDTMQRPESVPAPQPRLQTTQPPAFSSKVSSYHETSSEGEQASQADPPQASTAGPSKRQREDQDLDFDMDVLTKKSISDLDTIPFTVDPRLPVAEPAVDATGTPMTLAAKLTNLTKMRPDDQRQLFRSLTDAEREQTAAWFLDKFHADVQRLMEVRLERRKVALRYELEVKKREKSVQTKMVDVEDELAGLRKGGGELISGKMSGKTTED